MEGQIDLWGTVDNVTWVIDYKSGSSRYSEKAFKQLFLYAHALQVYGIKNEIRLAIIFAAEGKTLIRKMDSEGLNYLKSSLAEP
jgi:hypothetical protein